MWAENEEGGPREGVDRKVLKMGRGLPVLRRNFMLKDRDRQCRQKGEGNDIEKRT